MTRFRKILYYIGIICGWAIFSWQIFNAIKAVLDDQVVLMAPSAVFFAFIAMLVFLGLQVFNWCLMLDGVGIKLSWIAAVQGYSLSFISRYIPGTVWGYLSRSEWASREFGIPYRQSGAASMIEILISITSSFTVLGLIGFLSPDIGKGPWIIAAISVSVLVWLVIENIHKYDHFVFFKMKIQNPMIQIPIKNWIMCNTIFIFQWLIYGLIIWLMIYAFEGNKFLDSNILTGIINGTFAFTFAWTIGFLIPFLPGGLGIREVVLAIFISQFFQLDMNRSTIVAICLRMMNSIAEITWILWGFIRKLNVMYPLIK